MNVAGREIGPGHSCFIVAEISCNHMGNLANAYKLIDCAWWAGADAVKFQAFTVEENLASRGDGPAPEPWGHMSKRELYTLCRTPFDWFPELFNHARQRGIIPFSSVSGSESLALLESLDCPAYKIAKPELERRDVWVPVAMLGKPIIWSTPTYRMAIEHPERDALLYCPPGYPTQAKDVALQPFNQHVKGLSSHCLLPELSIAAVARGASILEYHLMLSGTHPLDETFSHTPESFKAMVQSIRRTEALCAP